MENQGKWGWQAPRPLSQRIPRMVVKVGFSECNEVETSSPLGWICRQGRCSPVLDASEKTYAACIYNVAPTTDSKTQSSPLVVKTKIPLVKSPSTPRLEFIEALLGERLLMSTLKANIGLQALFRNFQIGTQYAWTDSVTISSWHSRESSRWSTFVRNLVSKFQGQKSIAWNHVALIQMQSRHTRSVEWA